MQVIVWILLLLAMLLDWLTGDGEGRRPPIDRGEPVEIRELPDGTTGERIPVDPGLPDVILQGDPPSGWALGTAFAVDPDTLVTAAHVVEGCSSVALDVRRAAGRYAAVREVYRHAAADVAVLRTAHTAPELPVGDDRALRRGDVGYGFGFPSGEPSVIAGELMGRTRARAERGHAWSPVLVWALLDRAPDSDAPLGGISGGPMLDGGGRVIGVVIASGSERRPRVVTTTVPPVDDVLRGAATPGDPRDGDAVPVTPERARRYENLLRENRTVVAVYCRAGGPGRRPRI